MCLLSRFFKNRHPENFFVALFSFMFYHTIQLRNIYEKFALFFFSLLKAKGTPAMKNVQKIAGNGRKMVILWCCYVSLDYQKKKHKILHYQGNVFSTYIQGYNRILVDFTFFLQCTFMSDFGT